VPAVGAVERDAAIHQDPGRRGGWVDASDRAVGEPVWSLRLSPDHGGVAAGGLECGTGPGTADLAAGRVESTGEAEAARPAVAERRFVRAASAGA